MKFRSTVGRIPATCGSIRRLRSHAGRPAFSWVGPKPRTLAEGLRALLRNDRARSALLRGFQRWPPIQIVPGAQFTSTGALEASDAQHA